MNEGSITEPTVVEGVPTESVTVPVEGTDPAPTDATVPESTQETVSQIPETIYEDLSGAQFEGTEEVTQEYVTVEVLESACSDIAHASLFSGFLVSGTLVGIFLLRKIYGT